MAYTTIDDPSVYFQTKIYTGNATDDTAYTNDCNSDLQPDLLWVKNRSVAVDHVWFDSTRGVTKNIRSNSANTESTNSNYLKSFNSDGFTMGTSSRVNGNTNNMVAWQWKANGGTRTTFSESGNNPAGGYQANTTSGFSIVDYTGTGGNGTVAHGLGAVPHVMLFKCRSVGYHWIMYHQKLTSAPETDGIKLDVAESTGDYIFYFQDTAPTSSVFTLGTSSPGDSGFNDDGATNMAYLWTEKQGFSKFGTFKGNNKADGVFIYTGFKPAFFLWKRYDHSSGWGLIDSTRNPTNQGFYQAFPHDTGEGNYAIGDFVSNGIKMRNTFGDTNSENPYIYMAFAENPFVSSEGVPCTAR